MQQQRRRKEIEKKTNNHFTLLSLALSLALSLVLKEFLNSAIEQWLEKIKINWAWRYLNRKLHVGVAPNIALTH